MKYNNIVAQNFFIDAEGTRWDSPTSLIYYNDYEIVKTKYIHLMGTVASNIPQDYYVEVTFPSGYCYYYIINNGRFKYMG